MTSGDEKRCRARTESGQRCSRPAQENGFCHQHGPDDDTVEEGETSESSEQQDSQRTETMSDNGDTDIQSVRQQVQSTAEDVVGHPLDGITSVDRDDENWRVSIEVVERKGVPDTQDILGRYEMMLDEELNVDSYERTHRFRRDDMEHNV